MLGCGCLKEVSLPPYERPISISPEDVRATNTAEALLNPANPRERFVLERLQHSYEVASSNEGFQRFLRFIPQEGIRRYTPTNLSLIFGQFPEATAVMGRGDREGRSGWRSIGRQVKDGERPINILAPRKKVYTIEDPDTGEPRKYERLVGFKIVDVFDISQTDGPPIEPPDPPRETFDTTEEAVLIDRRISSFLIGEGLRLEKKATPNVRGYFDPQKREIALNELLPDDDGKAKTLAHEAAHYLAGDKAGFAGRNLREFIAEGAAHAALLSQGVDTSRYSIPYLQWWARNPQMMSIAMPRIAEVTKKLISIMENEQAENIGEWL